MSDGSCMVRFSCGKGASISCTSGAELGGSLYGEASLWVRGARWLDPNEHLLIGPGGSHTGIPCCGQEK